MVRETEPPPLRGGVRVGIARAKMGVRRARPAPCVNNARFVYVPPPHVL